MTSLRRTRRFSSAAIPAQESTHQDFFYDSPPRTLNVKASSNPPDTPGRSTLGKASRIKTVRKVKSEVSASSSPYGGDGERANTPARSHLTSNIKDGHGMNERKKKRKKSKRSQSEQATEGQELLDDDDSPHIMLAQESKFLTPKSRSRSVSHSPAPGISSASVRMRTGDLDEDEDTYSDGDIGEHSESKPRHSKVSNAREPRYKLQPSKKQVVENSYSQKTPQSKLRTFKNQTASSAPPSTPVPNEGIGTSAYLDTPSPSARLSSMPSLSVNSRREASRTPDLESIAGPSQRKNSGSRIPQVNAHHESSPSPLPAASRTLKDVTRRLGQNNGSIRMPSSPSGSETRNNGSSLKKTNPPTPVQSMKLHTGAEISVKPSIVIEHARSEYPQDSLSRYPLPKLVRGLALTTEGGDILGERSVIDVRSRFPPERAKTPDIPSTTNPFLSKPLKSALAVRPASATGFNVIYGHETGSQSKLEGSFPGVNLHSSGKVAAQLSGKPPHSNAKYKPTFETPQRSQFQGSHEQGNSLRHISRPHASGSPSMLASPMPSSPRQSPIFADKKHTPSAYPGLPALPSSRLPRPESPISHRASGSDTSVQSMPRLRKLVIRNPDLRERPSSSSSSNLDTPLTAAGTGSQDFSIMAISTSQMSCGGPAKMGNYIVPDEVAAEISNEDERRRRALAGLVDGLCLGKDDQTTHLPKEVDVLRPHSSMSQNSLRTRWKHNSPRTPDDEEDDEEDDDKFFSQLSVHEDSLLEEPEPDVEAGFKDDMDFGFDDDSIDSQGSETDQEEEEEEEGDVEAPLPPTPKFVHPLTDGDDLESRISRVASLHRISTTPVSFHQVGKDHGVDAPESHERQGYRSRKDRPTDQFHKSSGVDVDYMTSAILKRHNENSWTSHTSETSRLEASNTFDNHEHCHGSSTVILGEEYALSSQQSLSSHINTDNEVSSVGAGRLSELGSGTEGALSSGAEALFRKLQVEAEKREAGPNGSNKGNTLGTDLDRDINVQSQGSHEGLDVRIAKGTPGSILSRTWRSTLPSDAYDSLAERHGPSEMRRQEVIWELCETEQTFVKSLRLILRLFVKPLRYEDKSWLRGVPSDVTRLFDWFDDIMQLHSQISSALHATRSAQYPVVIQVAETLRPFVSRLELHQPYLVKLESVTSAIEVMSKDMFSDFGEFIRIQTASPECESMNLPSFLLKPVQRLMKYPLFFKQLWELTPRNHPDHLATFSLLHSTDMIIRVMQEVKAREEEYELVKNLASRIKGLPPGFQLARRERRLVAQGLLRRVILSDKERHALEGSPDPSNLESSQTTPLSRKTSVSSDASSFTGDWSHPTIRANNLLSFETNYNFPANPASLDTSRTAPRRARSSSLRGSLRHKLKETSVYAFVFTDLIILTTPNSEKLHLLRSPKTVSETKESWKLVEDVGISRVLGVTDQSRQLSSHDYLITVDLMPMTPKSLDSGVFSDAAPVVSVYLSVPDQKISPAEDSLEILAEAKTKWLDAFERCFRFTLRSLSFPSYTANFITNARTADFESDTRHSVMSILASGLPLPMSPSQQLDEAQRGRPTDHVQEEREERGWWSLRFQQVLKEMQRSNRSPVLDAGLGRTFSKRQGGKRSEPRPLLLSSNPSDTPSRKNSILSIGRKKLK